MYNYMDNLKGYDGRRSVHEILSLTTFDNWEILKTEYDATQISTVKIDGNTFGNYGQYQFIWEKTFVKSPERSSSGSIGNLNSYATFLTPHLTINFAVMSIDDYRRIMKLHYERNEFTVECFDIIYNRPIKVKMYLGTEEMAKLFTINKKRLGDNNEWLDWIELVGVQDYTVELIGTNNDLDLVSVKYEYSTLKEDGTLEYPYLPNGSLANPQFEEDVYIGEEIVVGSASTFPTMPPTNALKFKEWVDESGEVYTNGVVTTVNEPLVLYAVWESTNKFTLGFNYGLSDVDFEVDSATGVMTEILDREVQKWHSIGKLPKLTTEPSVKGADNKLYYPYHNGGWYKHPVKQEDMRVHDNDSYWLTRDTVIYALYDKKPFTVTYHTNTWGTYIPQQTLYYGDSVYLPTLWREGYTFQGWYVDEGLTSVFGGNMPPYSINLYARWKKV